MNIPSVDSLYLLNNNLNSSYIPLQRSMTPNNPNQGIFEEMLEKAYGGTSSSVAGPVDETIDGFTDSLTSSASGGKAVIDKTSQLFEMCQELETFMLKNLIKSMRSTIQKSELIDTGFAGQFYEDMLYDEYAKDFAKNAGFGFAEMAYLELTGQRGKALSNRP